MIGYENWGLALVHFLWQGLLVAVVLFGTLRAMKGARPELRYAVSLSALALMVAFPIITLWSLENRGPGGIGLEPRQAELPADIPRAAAPPPQQPGDAAPGATDAGVEEAGETGATTPGMSAAGGRGIPSLLQRGSVALQPYLGWIVVAWAAGVLVLSLRLFGGWIQLRRLTRVGGYVVPDSVREMARIVAARLAVSRPVTLVHSTRAAVPAVVGWLRPVILLPASALTGLTPAQLEVILAHELAHIRRHDYLVNLIQTVVETLFFYHPAIWWVSGRIRDEREHCCDELAVTVCGDRAFYARALLDLETLRPSQRLAVAADGGSLVMRVQRLIGPRVSARDTLPRWPAALSTVTIATAMTLACTSDALLAPPGPTDPARSATLFVGEAFGTRVFRYAITEHGGVLPDGEVVQNVEQPVGIAFSESGEMFVANRTGTISRYLDPEGAATPNGLITAPETGAPFGQPHFLTFRNDELLVAQPSGTLLRFTFDASGSAVFRGTIRAGDETRGITTNPTTGELFVSKLENAIHRFSFDAADDASPVGLVTGGGLNHTHGMTFTPWGELLVANAYGNSISRFVFDEAGNAVPNGVISGGGLSFPVDLDFSPEGELFVTNHNEIPGRITRWTFASRDASAEAVSNGWFEIPANLGGLRFSTGGPND